MDFLKGTLCVLVAYVVLIRTVVSLCKYNTFLVERMLRSNILTNATIPSKITLFFSVVLMEIVCP